MNRVLPRLLAAVILCLFFLGFAYYWYELKFYPSTDNAYVKANIIHLAPNINGPIDSVLIKDNEPVKKGQLLYTIDKRPFQLAWEKAKADLDLAEQAREANFEAVEIAKANIAKANASLNWAEKNYNRIKKLVQDGRASISSGDKALSDYQMAQASLREANSQFAKAMVNLGPSSRANAAIKQAKALVKQAELNLSYTEIYAPKDGLITHFSLKPGDMAELNQSNVALVDPSEFWVEANFKETQLKRLKEGQTATLTLDMEPDKTLTGKIESISASTGQTFALIPQENSGGNWVKVVQRIPVKIAIVDNPKNPILRVGASTTVKVNTHG